MSLSLGNFNNAREILSKVLFKTELIHSSVLSYETGNQVYLKPENLQRTGSFKIRGAYYKISQLDELSKKRGIICSSAGNHAQGVAYSSKALGVNSTIVMPKITPIIKVDSTRAYGSRVILAGNIYDEAFEEAMRQKEEQGLTFVHPYNDYEVMTGQGTIGLEILEELPDVDYILVPVGGGGLLAGVLKAIKQSNPKVKVIGVEPLGACGTKASIDNKCIVHLDTVETIAEGVAVKAPGNLAFDIIHEYVDDIICVSDFEIMESFLLLLEKHKLIAEAAGVLSVAALKKLKCKDKKVVSLISGGNIDVVTVSSMINKGLITRGRLFSFMVELPDTPGQLLKISQILADLNANVIKLDHNQFSVLDRFRNVELEVTIETFGHDHLKVITTSLVENGFKIKAAN